MSKVSIEGDCWMWQAYRDPEGYGRFYFNGSQRQAHRVSHELFIGPIPDGLTVDHLCYNPPCVNPAHLEAVTIQVNCGERNRNHNRLKTHCKRGHPYDGTNTVHVKGGRWCRTCRDAYTSAYWKTRVRPSRAKEAKK